MTSVVPLCFQRLSALNIQTSKVVDWLPIGQKILVKKAKKWLENHFLSKNWVISPFLLIKNVLFDFCKVQPNKTRHFDVATSYSEAIKIITWEQNGLDRKPVVSSLAPANVKNLLFEDNLKSFETLSVHGASLVSLKTSHNLMTDCFMEKEYMEGIRCKRVSGLFFSKKIKKTLKNW